MDKIAVIYYSLKGETIAPGMKIVNLEKGHTAVAAEFVQKAVGGELIELDTIKTYLKDHMKMIYEAKEELDINSPSRVFAKIGEFMAAGLGVGFVSEMRAVERNMRRQIPKEFEAPKAARSAPLEGRFWRGEDDPAGRGGRPWGSGVMVVQNIYGSQTSYAAQQREAARQFKLIAREI